MSGSARSRVEAERELTHQGDVGGGLGSLAGLSGGGGVHALDVALQGECDLQSIGEGEPNGC